MITSVALLLTVAAGALSSQADDAVQAHRDALDLPGVAAVVVVDDELRYAGAAGVADLQSGRELTADTPLYAGSLSKLFTAILVLNAVERGELTLDASPDSGGAVDAANLRNLLTHNSGLPREGEFGYWFSGEFPDGDKLESYLREVNLNSAPGTTFSYSNIGYATLGLLLERTLEDSYGDLLSERVLGPLNLTASRTGAPAADLSRGYTPTGRLVPSDERPFAGVGAQVKGRRLREYHHARAMTPAFGVQTSARDLGKLAVFLMDETHAEVLSPELRRQIMTPQASGWGLGLGVDETDGRRVAKHGGWFAAHRSQLIVDPAAGIAVVVLANSDDGRPGRLANRLYEFALAATERRERR